MSGGSSLWLVPPEDSALYRTCHRLITRQIPSLFPGAVPPPPVFSPHVTLTPDTVPSGLLEQEQQEQGRERRQSTPSSTDPAISAQSWLDELVLPSPTRELRVAIQSVQVEGHFFRKLTMQCEKGAQLCELAATCRAAHGVAGLLDGGKQEGAEKLEEAGKWVRECYRPHLSLMYSDLPEDEVRIKLDEVNSKISQAKQANPDSLTAKGAEIWLVPTYKPIEEWQPIAKREVPYGVQWEWQT
ncbi:hypothetical protein KC340_g14791 [Hortaea werneckii]|nr:hypothetical protein KC342_g15148 [Hortaea werneckii]KAI7064586.1 hypothetical protein KC339_g15989 [Hortaea werneckii]KAI7218082.1 hypothetical protein KC365_g12740 [Hortaea werneckii]KAI7297678.1 hypothetical protein KC340_g14791 [Hortaea werneckii]KAI7373266.1 hypothetical protein KC328_g16722 [Hortaea werneckii]